MYISLLSYMDTTHEMKLTRPEKMTNNYDGTWTWHGMIFDETLTGIVLIDKDTDAMYTLEEATDIQIDDIENYVYVCLGSRKRVEFFYSCIYLGYVAKEFECARWVENN